MKSMSYCKCNTNIIMSDEESVDGCINDCVITYKEVCPECGNETYGWEISDRDGEFIDGDGGYDTREAAAKAATNADDSIVCDADFYSD